MWKGEAEFGQIMGGPLFAVRLSNIYLVADDDLGSYLCPALLCAGLLVFVERTSRWKGGELINH
ncbi:MAG: hypothetical protein PHR65_07265 [Syntrophomonadaceae bacterium]|nr:hypothetical protein [Syntrophomonadaceae bacterium]